MCDVVVTNPMSSDISEDTGHSESLHVKDRVYATETIRKVKKVNSALKEKLKKSTSELWRLKSYRQIDIPYEVFWKVECELDTYCH